MTMSTSSSKAYLVYVAGKNAGESYLLCDVSREDFMGIPCIKGTYDIPHRRPTGLPQKRYTCRSIKF